MKTKLMRKVNTPILILSPTGVPITFLSRNYIGHLVVIRKNLIDQTGGFRIGFEGSQDYDLLLRVTELTEKIHHIPLVLYHWRMHRHPLRSMRKPNRTHSMQVSRHWKKRSKEKHQRKFPSSKIYPDSIPFVMKWSDMVKFP
jgi:hypothetical protein